MNKSEVVAEKWIIEKHGEKPIFQIHKSPDFLVNGSAYEVKLGYLDRQKVVHINMRREQVEAIVHEYPACELLVVTDGLVDVLALPKYESHPQKIGDDFVIHWLTSPSPGGMNVIVKDFPEDEWRKFKAEAVKRGITLKEAVAQATAKWREE